MAFRDFKRDRGFRDCSIELIRERMKGLMSNFRSKGHREEQGNLGNNIVLQNPKQFS